MEIELKLYESRLLWLQKQLLPRSYIKRNVFSIWNIRGFWINKACTSNSGLNVNGLLNVIKTLNISMWWFNRKHKNSYFIHPIKLRGTYPWCQGMKDIFVEFYTRLFHSNATLLRHRRSGHFHHLFLPQVFAIEATFMTALPTEFEIKCTIFSMNKLKSPGSYDLTVDFFSSALETGWK